MSEFGRLFFPCFLSSLIWRLFVLSGRTTTFLKVTTIWCCRSTMSSKRSRRCPLVISDLDWHLNTAFIQSYHIPAPLFPSVTHLSLVVFEPDHPPLSIFSSFPRVAHVLLTIAEDGNAEYQNDFIESVAMLPQVEVLVVYRHGDSPKPRASLSRQRKVVELARGDDRSAQLFRNIVFSTPESVWTVARTVIAERSHSF
ncbi:hypothetical protein DL96DRAFT_1280909 [Flagelloscypha sp. PMI_526]|nr:hypothetical protein DL96DRAFT_1280909 [Flagelloscypha sp. PMI_526]